MSYSSEVLADSPLAYWKLDETSGSVAADSSGNGRDAAYGGGNTLGATSLLTDGTGHALGLTANTSNGVSIAAASWMSVTALTAEALVNFTSSVDGSNGDAIVDQYGGGGFRWLLWRNTTGKAALQLTNGTTFYNVASTTTLSLNTTYHVAGTWDGSNIRIYLNGSLENTTATTGTLPASSQVLAIGAYSNSSSTAPGGSIDEVAIYGTALSGTRIAAHYTAATSAPADATVTAVAATATASTLAPALSAGWSVAAVAATASATALPPVVSTQGDATVAAVAATATASAAVPVLHASATVVGSAAAAIAAALVPTLSRTTSVSAVAATATATAHAPTVTDGSGSQTVFAVPATATAAALAPVVEQVFAAGTDTTNALNGRDRRASATVTIATPVLAPPATLVLATKVDKAIAYPAPVMVDGRPT